MPFHPSEPSNKTGHLWLSFHVHTGVLQKAWADDQTQFAILLTQLQLVKGVDLCLLFITYAPWLLVREQAVLRAS